MGEYATRKRDGERVKIGTCESMYYLRFEQADQVDPEPGNVDPVKDAPGLRFRFPFPDEDGTRPGEFDRYNRGIPIDGLEAGPEVRHEGAHFTAPGYQMTLPCPEGPGFPSSLPLRRNGLPGQVVLTAHRYRPELGRLVPVFRCGGCGAMWREEDPAELDRITVLIRNTADKCREEADAKYWHTVADRLAPVVTVRDSLAVLFAAF